jgi:hypothetical protein
MNLSVFERHRPAPTLTQLLECHSQRHEHKGRLCPVVSLRRCDQTTRTQFSVPIEFAALC